MPTSTTRTTSSTASQVKKPWPPDGWAAVKLPPRPELNAESPLGLRPGPEGSVTPWFRRWNAAGPTGVVCEPFAVDPGTTVVAYCGLEVDALTGRWRVGVGSKGCQPMPGKYTSTQAWASRSETTYGPFAVV